MVDKTQVDKQMEDTLKEFQKENPGQTLNQAQLDAMRSSIEKNLSENDSIRDTTRKGTTILFTTLNAGAVAMDGTAMFAAGAKGNLPGQVRSYGWDVATNMKEIGAASKTTITEGLLTASGRSASISTLRATGSLAARASIPLTIGLGAYETYHNIQEGNRKGAYEAGAGTALSLGASIAAGAAAGTMVTPLVGTIVGALVGVAGYYGGRYLGGAYADATDPQKDFEKAAAPAPYTPSRMSATFDPKMFQKAPDTQGAFTGAVKPVGVDVTKVAEPNTEATNDQTYKKTAQMFTYR